MIIKHYLNKTYHGSITALFVSSICIPFCQGLKPNNKDNKRIKVCKK